MAHHKPESEKKDADKKTCGQSFTNFFKDLKNKFDCSKHKDDKKVAKMEDLHPPVVPRR